METKITFILKSNAVDHRYSRRGVRIHRWLDVKTTVFVIQRAATDKRKAPIIVLVD